MPKRFTATEKWTKSWHRELPPRLKCLWSYVCANCDAAGIYDPDLELASFQIGERVTEADLKHFAEQICVLENGKWFILDFVEFQYGELRDGVAPHRGAIKSLNKNGIDVIDGLPSVSEKCKRVIEGLRKPSIRLQDKDKDKDKDKEGGVGETKPKNSIKPTPEEVGLQCAKIGLPLDEGSKFFDYYESNGWRVGRNPMKSWVHALSNWKRNWSQKSYGNKNNQPGNQRRFDRNQGTFNEGKSSLYGKAAKRGGEGL